MDERTALNITLNYIKLCLSTGIPMDLDREGAELLLDYIDKQQAVIDAAREMRPCISYRDVMFNYPMDVEARIQRWDDALDKLDAGG